MGEGVAAVKRRGIGGGRPRSAIPRGERLVCHVPAEDMRDVDVLCRAWGVTRSVLGWCVIHEWMCGLRGEGMEVGGFARAGLRAAVEMALQDVEMRSWISRKIEKSGGATGARS